MENKYYTPEIEEFHVGFHYEELMNGKWAPDIFEPNLYCDDRDMFLNGLDKETIRVKYLDQEDIESLGFEEIVDENYGRYQWMFTNGHVRVFTRQWGKKIVIAKEGWVGGSNNILYLGSCKNKSELKRILKQIGYEGVT